MPTKTFDPMRCLECDMRVSVSVIHGSQVVLSFNRGHSRMRRSLAKSIVRDYHGVIVLQHQTGMSAKELLMHGKIAPIHGRLALK